MNKDMMNIDDFVREKLGGHTEKEDQAAWLKMKALLDEEMPEKAAPFMFRLGKPLAFLGAALLIGALCVGGYQLNALRNKSELNESSATANNNNSSANNSIQAPIHTPEHNQENNSGITNNPITNENSSNTNAPIANNNVTGTSAGRTDGSSDATAAHKTESVSTGSHNAATNGIAQSDKNIASGQQQKPSKHSSANTSSSNDQKATAKNTPNDHSLVSKDAANNNSATQDQQNSSDRKVQTAHTSTQSKTTNLNKPILTSAATTTHNKHADKALDKTAANKQIAGNDHTKTKQPKQQNDQADNSNNATGVAKADPPKSKDSMSAINVVTREQTSRTFPKTTTKVVDTLAQSKVALPSAPEVKPVLTAANTTVVSNVVPSKKQIKLAAAESKKANKRASKAEVERRKNTYASSNNGNMTTTSSVEQKGTATNTVVKKEKSSLSKWIQNMNLPDAVASAKRDVGNAQFYAGFTGGLNYSVNNNNNFLGIQFGPTGELVFNKHWSLFGELKYFNRSGGKKTVDDSYSKEVSNNNIDSTKGANYYFTVLTDSTNRRFNFSTVHSFELPITLRYAFNKFYLMTGINLAYYLTVNVEMVENQYNMINSHAVSTNTTKPILAETKPQLLSSDFGSRFGMGYVIGAGYQISPAWQTDIRVVRSFWDNAKGDGASRLSKDFYRLPSVQISVGYQFNRGKTRPTFGPTTAP